MYQTPLPIWNEIAQTQDLATPRWRRLLSLAPQYLPGLSLEMSVAIFVKSSQVQLMSIAFTPTFSSMAVSYTMALELEPRLTP